MVDPELAVADPESGSGATSRRSVIVGAGVAVVAAAAGAAWYTVAKPAPRATPAAGGYPEPSTATGTPTALAAIADIPEGGGIVLDDKSIVLTREAGDKVHCFSAVCTHQGCLVNEVSNGQIKCPCHGSAFDANTGEVVAGPAPSPLPPVTVTVVNGSVYTG